MMDTLELDNPVPQPPEWHSEEWKPGRWLVVKGQGTNRKVHGPTFGSEATIFASEDEAAQVASDLNLQGD